MVSLSWGGQSLSFQTITLRIMCLDHILSHQRLDVAFSRNRRNKVTEPRRTHTVTKES